VFKLIDGEFTHADCYVEVLMDDMLFPSYSSAKIKSKAYTFNETGDAMVRELDFSKITLRLIEKVDRKGDDKEDHVIAKLTGSTLDTLQRCLYTPTQLTLRSKDGQEAKLTVSLKYLPVKMQLDLSESFNNSGTLRVEVLDAADLPAADRNGFSDPYAKFNLNGKEIFKTKTQKKTLHPAWNEFFEIQVRSRTAANFEVAVYDWDFGDKADFLGRAAINLNILEPFQAQEVTLGLDGKSGAIRLKMLFKPDYVTRSRQGSSTFHGTFAVPGKVIGAPVKGVGKGAVLVGGGVVKGASFLGRGFKRRKSRGGGSGEDLDDDVSAGATNGSAVESTLPPPALGVEGNLQRPATPIQSSASHGRHASWGARSISSQAGVSPSGAAETGTASFSIVSASGYPPGTNVRVHVRMATPKGEKEVHKTNDVENESGEVTFDPQKESFKVPCAADTQFKIVVKDHHTFKSDDELGEGVCFVDDQGSGGTEKAVNVGNGKVVLRSGFVPDERSSVAGSMEKSPKVLKRSLLGTKRESRASTPA
jgi:hypothetical protein